jgi:hypothetical protein
MQNVSWATLFHHIPPERQLGMILVTRAHTEIAIQSFMRIDHEFVAVKGRLSGSQETGRVFFIPYSEINYLGFMNAVTDNDFHELFDSLRMAPPAYLPGEQEAFESVEEALPRTASKAEKRFQEIEASSQSGATDFGQTMMAPRPQTDIKIRSEVLERFRAKNNGSKGPGAITHHQG